MSATQMVGHRLLVGLPGPELDDETIRLVREYKISNFILMARNVVDKQQTAGLCAALQTLVQQETGRPALIAADQEGGTVTRLPPDATLLPGAMAVASTGSVENALLAGRITGQELAAMGVNFNLAPVLDVNCNPENPVIGERSYGDDAATVTRFGLAMLQGLGQGGVLGCAKHFPGHGDTHVDSHLALPVIDKGMAALRETELKPFAAAIAAGVPAIMSSHISMPALEPDGLPNTLSRRVMTGLLREELGFTGLVVSDCLEMNAISEGVGTAPGAVLAAAAGVDLLCICHTPRRMEEAAQLLRQALADGRLDAAEMAQAVQRVLACKAQAGAMAASRLPLAIVGSEEHRQAARAMRLAAISLAGGPAAPLPPLGASPLFVGSHAFRTTVASSPEDTSFSFPQWMETALGGKGLLTAVNPTEAEIDSAAAAAAKASCVVAGSYNGRFQPGQQQLLQRLAAVGVPMVHVALRTPYDLTLSPATVWKLAAFEYTPECFAALAEILAGRAAPRGRLSVALGGPA